MPTIHIALRSFADDLAKNLRSFQPTGRIELAAGRVVRPSLDIDDLDLPGRLRQSPGMAIARIIEEQRKTTQSGKAKAGRWTLEFERQQPMRPDPLTGWSGSGDTNTQLRISFDSKDEALAYAKMKGLDIHLIPAGPIKLKIQAYADNFR